MSDDLSMVEITGWYGEDDCETCQRWREIREALAAKAALLADPAPPRT